MIIDIIIHVMSTENRIRKLSNPLDNSIFSKTASSTKKPRSSVSREQMYSYMCMYQLNSYECIHSIERCSSARHFIRRLRLTQQIKSFNYVAMYKLYLGIGLSLVDPETPKRSWSICQLEFERSMSLLSNL